MSVIPGTVTEFRHLTVTGGFYFIARVDMCPGEDFIKVYDLYGSIKFDGNKGIGAAVRGDKDMVWTLTDFENGEEAGFFNKQHVIASFPCPDPKTVEHWVIK